MTFRKSLTAAAVAASLGFPALAIAQDAQSDVNVEEEVERIEITGSRIKRTDMEGALPVTVLDKTDIEMTGENSLSDVLRNTTFNAAGSFRPQSGSGQQGVSSVNMRGLGADRTLILIDGRRLPKSPLTGSSQDLNSVPLAAVERIEILSDGASAVYGSDAIGGVINIITRKDFDGIEFRLGFGEVSIPEEGGDREEGSIVFGTSGEKGRVIGGVSWNSRDIIFQRHFPWNEPGASSYGNNWRDASRDDEEGLYTATGVEGSYNPQGPLSGIPGGCGEENFFENGDACAYDFTSTAADEASTGNESIFVRGDYEINRDWSVYANASYTSSDSFGKYAPVPVEGLMAPDSPNNPTNPEGNVYDPEAGDQRPVFWYHRFAALGDRDNSVNNEVRDVMAGAQGIWNGLDIEFGARRTKSKTYDIGRNYVVLPITESNINDGTYDLQNPSDNDIDTLNSMKTVTTRISEFNQDEVFGSVGFDLFSMDAGVVQAVVGFEYRTEDYSDQYDSLSEASAIGGSSGNSAGGGRNVRSAYIESLVPLTHDLEMTVAGRFDEYSDYGNDFSPKVSFRYNATQDLVLRASYGEGFKAPTLDILTQQPAFSADSVVDIPTCDSFGVLEDGECPGGGVQINGLRIANDELQSETSTQFALGAAYQITDNLSTTLDYYNIEIDNQIAFIGANTLVAREQAGDPIPAGLGVRRDPETGAIIQVISGYTNEGNLETSGLDFSLIGNMDFGSAGTLVSDLQLSYVHDYVIDGGRNRVKDPSRPEMRGAWNNSYTYSDLRFAWNMNYIGDQHVDLEGNGHVPSWITHDVQGSYFTPWGGQVSLGVRNVFEKEPPLIPVPGSTRPYNFDLYDGYGRVTYLRYTQTF